MAVSGIGNSGAVIQQPYSSSRSAEPGRSAAENGQALSAGGGQERVSGQSRRDDAEDRRIQQEVQQLKATEVKVKAHEAAHKAAGGQYASSASYSYRPGPDGRSYIVAGEVQIDMSPGRTPQETIAKMQIVQRAALAPADPSGQDRAVAAAAAAQMAQAQQEQVKQANADQAATTADGGSGNGVTSKTGTSVNGASQLSGAPTGEAASPSSGRRTGVTPEDAAAVATKERQDVEIRQVGAYKANTTPGDIFGAQKISTYA